jgi:SAM-dependent methyltransferase
VSAAERDKWDARYRDGAYENRTHATALLAAWLPRLPLGAALDVACGAGRNALHLAAHGFAVTALDISAVALERGRREAAARNLRLVWSCTDLDDEPDTALPPGPFELIVWVRYVHRGLMPHLLERLASGGTLLCEQHLATTAEVAGPTSAAFRLASGELVRSAPGLDVLHAYEGLLTDPDRRTVAVTQLVGTKRA